MAINFKSLDDKFRNEPLKKDELQVIKEVEDYIDRELTSKYIGEPIKINLSIVKFQRTLDLKFGRNIPPYRSGLMYDELIDRYYNAGWYTEEELNDDGPNDYWVLKGKK
jgi:hypothetical protein